MKKFILILYLVPCVFLSMFLMWLKENALTLTLVLILLALTPYLAFLHAKNGGKIYGIIIGNAVSFLCNMAPILYLNKIDLRDSLGGTWHGHFKPFYAEQISAGLFVILLVLQIIIYARASKIYKKQ